MRGEWERMVVLRQSVFMLALYSVGEKYFSSRLHRRIGSTRWF